MTFKKFLQDNKIYFEVFAAIFLGVMSIIVSLKSNEIASIQTNVMKSQNQPVFYLEIKREVSSEVYNEKLLVYNLGGAVNDLSSEDFIFLDIGYHIGSREEMKSVFIPIVEYYSEYYLRNRNQEVLELSGGDYERLDNLIKQFISYAEDKDKKKVSVRVVRFIKLKYTDIFGDRQAQFFILYPDNYFYKLKSFNKVEEYYSKTFKKEIDLSKIKYQQIYSLWKDLLHDATVSDALPLQWS